MSGDPVLAALRDNRAAALDRLFDLLRCPSVSTDPAYAAGMAAARDLLKRRLAAFGFAKVQELAAGGHPAIFAERCDTPGRPTFLVYGHYDVQPPDPAGDWLSPAFEPTVRDGKLFARGVSDDKAPMSIAIETLAAFLRVEGRLPVNVKLLLEGEEECGSATLGAICERYPDLLAADAVISADGARWRTDLTTVNVGSRGNGGMEVSLRTADRDLHSGRYGGAVPNALHAMASLLASLHRPDGSIAVEGFLDGVRILSDAERAGLAAIPFDEAAFFADLDSVPYGETGYTTLERLWHRPTLEVNGLWGGYTGVGGKTIVPHEAHAKLTMRLVEGQRPDHVEAVVRRHLERHAPPGARLSIRSNRGWTAAYTVPPDHPLLVTAEAALETVTGARPLRVRIGATLPLSEIVATRLGLDTVMFSFSTADERFHAPNEYFRLSSLDEGLAAWVALLRRLGRQNVDDYRGYRRRAP